MTQKIQTEVPICAVIAEYNPFHTGHEYHIAQTRAVLGECYVVVIMSGSFVQRGEPAVWNKFMRTHPALQCGADAVLELPAAYVLQSADYFAKAGVRIAQAIGARYLSFGSEYPLSVCRNIARTMGSMNVENAQLVRDDMRKGASYARSLGNYLHNAGIEYSANAMLGGMYMHWIDTLACNIEPVVIYRDNSVYPHASDIRSKLIAQKPADDYLKKVLPSACIDALDGADTTDDALYQNLMLFALRTQPICDAMLAGRVSRLSRTCTSYIELLTQAKTKNITMARLKRACTRTLLGMDEQFITSANREMPVYARLLGYRAGSERLLSLIGNKSTIPFITSPAAFTPLTPLQERLFTFDIAATDIWNLTSRDVTQRYAGQDYTQGVQVE